MRDLKSKEVLKYISDIFYKHDIYYHLRKMGAPKNEYNSWAEHLIKRLDFEKSFRRPIPLYRDENKNTVYSPLRENFTLEEILEQIGRTFDYYEMLDGSISEFFSLKDDKYEVSGYTEPNLNPCDRKKLKNLAIDIYNFLVKEEEVSLDTSEIDEGYRKSLISAVLRVMEEQGYTFEEIQIDGQWELDGMNIDGLNELLFEINPPAHFVDRKKNEND